MAYFFVSALQIFFTTSFFACMVYDDKSTWIFILVLLARYSHPLQLLLRFFLVFWNYFSVLQDFWICDVLLSVIIFGKFSAIITSNMSSALPFLSSSESSISYMLPFKIVLQFLMFFSRKFLLTYLQGHWFFPQPFQVYWWTHQRHFSFVLQCFLFINKNICVTSESASDGYFVSLECVFYFKCFIGY